MLSRKIDKGWEEVAPLEPYFAPQATRARPFIVHKRNFMGKEGTYALDYYRHSLKNLNLASINNHVTSGYTGVTTGMHGMAIAMNTDVCANFAFCPFKMTSDVEGGKFNIRANPFGTYHGDQIQPATQGNRLGYEAVLLAAPQFQSAAPTYNGYTDRFDLMVAFFQGSVITEHVKRDLITFARPPILVGFSRQQDVSLDTMVDLPPAGLVALPYQDGILFHWEHTGGKGMKYRLYCHGMSGFDKKVFTVSGTTMFLNTAFFEQHFPKTKQFSISIEAIHPNGQVSSRSPETHFKLATQANHSLNIPKAFKFKLLGANLNALLQRKLL
jgi:hypothetical protein